MQGMTVQLTLTQDQMETLARMVAENLPKRPVDRYADMVDRYGEACTITQACAALNVSRTTLYRMTNDGKIKMTRDGKRVDVRSMARYVEAG